VAATAFSTGAAMAGAAASGQREALGLREDRWGGMGLGRRDAKALYGRIVARGGDPGMRAAEAELRCAMRF
jgi:hypothetical protein